jgi:hypothetical protein
VNIYYRLETEDLDSTPTSPGRASISDSVELGTMADMSSAVPTKQSQGTFAQLPSTSDVDAPAEQVQH